MSLLDSLLARDLLPDPLLRFGMRRLMGQRLAQCQAGSSLTRLERQRALIADLRRGPIALETGAANEQHYEVPAEFYTRVLGRRLKYSSSYWPADVVTLDAAEEAMLELYLERGRFADGQRILELGCGWGSLTLFLAERFPASRILAISNSASQQEFIRVRAQERGLANVELRRADINDFKPEDSGHGRFDRVVSIEMFEHLRNYELLFPRIASWLEPGGELFVHVFCHHRHAYPFEDRGASDWMARYFFTGGLMPSADLLPLLCWPLRLDESWILNGRHYEKTANAWLALMDQHEAELLPILERVYGATEKRRFWAYWRVFFMACAELFGYRGGEEWGVAHYRFRLPPGPESETQ